MALRNDNKPTLPSHHWKGEMRRYEDQKLDVMIALQYTPKIIFGSKSEAKFNYNLSTI